MWTTDLYNNALRQIQLIFITDIGEEACACWTERRSLQGQYTETAIHIHICGQFRITSWPNPMHFFALLQEAKVLMETSPHRKKQNKNTEPSCRQLTTPPLWSPPEWWLFYEQPVSLCYTLYPTVHWHW